MAPLTHLPLANAPRSPFQQSSGDSPPPLEYDEDEANENRMEDDPAAAPPHHEHRGIPERYQQSQSLAASSPPPSSAAPAAAPSSNFIRPMRSSEENDEDEDTDMKESKSEEKVEERRNVPPPRSLRPFFVHQWIDVLDTQNTWLECQVIAIDNGSISANSSPIASSSSPSAASSNQRILVHFKGFKAKYDEWLDVRTDSSPDIARVALLHTHTTIPNRVPVVRPFTHIGDKVDCKDSVNTWLIATILAFDAQHAQVQVRYDGWGEKFDEWLDVESYRLQPLGLYTQAPIQAVKPRGVGGGRVYTNNQNSSHTSSSAAAGSHQKQQQFQSTIEAEARFRRILGDRLNSDIVDQKEDGNCLFRSVSHQVYGDAEHHRIVRKYTMDYIESERYFFENFIANETFEDYLARMRNDSEWGDNVEIQAMSEIYDRPIEIYAYSHKPLKTFTSSSSGVSDPLRPPPIRLSYHFASHYNSIVDRDRQRAAAACTTQRPSVIERAALERVATLRAQSGLAQLNSSSSLHASRQTFSSSQSRLQANPLDFENAVAASLSDMNTADAANIAQATQASLREHEEAQLLEATLQQSEVEAVQMQLDATKAADGSTSSSSATKPNIEEETLQRALAASLATAGGVATTASEEDELQRVLRESAAAAGGAGVQDDDAALRRVLQSSLADRDDQLPSAVKSCVAFGFPLDQCINAWTIIGDHAKSTGASEDIIVQRMMEYLCGQ